MPELDELRAEALGLMAELAAHPSPEGARKVAAIAKRARKQARRDKTNAAWYRDLAVRLERISASLLSVSDATDDLIASFEE